MLHVLQDLMINYESVMLFPFSDSKMTSNCFIEVYHINHRYGSLILQKKKSQSIADGRDTYGLPSKYYLFSSSLLLLRPLSFSNANIRA